MRIRAGDAALGKAAIRTFYSYTISILAVALILPAVTSCEESLFRSAIKLNAISPFSSACETAVLLCLSKVS
jgi:hypothetical protein